MKVEQHVHVAKVVGEFLGSLPVGSGRYETLLGENVWFGEEAIHVLSGGTSGRPFSRSGEQVARNQRHSSLQQRLTAQPNQQSFSAESHKPTAIAAKTASSVNGISQSAFRVTGCR